MASRYIACALCMCGQHMLIATKQMAVCEFQFLAQSVKGLMRCCATIANFEICFDMDTKVASRWFWPNHNHNTN